MTKTTKIDENRLKDVNIRNENILRLEINEANHEEMVVLREKLFEKLRASHENSVKLMIIARGYTYSPAEAKIWKANLELINEKVKKSAIVGLSPLAQMVMKGVRAYARLMGIEKKSMQAQLFDTEESALDYLSQA